MSFNTGGNGSNGKPTTPFNQIRPTINFCLDKQSNTFAYAWLAGVNDSLVHKTEQLIKWHSKSGKWGNSASKKNKTKQKNKVGLAKMDIIIEQKNLKVQVRKWRPGWEWAQREWTSRKLQPRSTQLLITPTAIRFLLWSLTTKVNREGSLLVISDGPCVKYTNVSQIAISE